MASDHSQVSVYIWTSVPADDRQSYRSTIPVNAATTVQDFYNQVATITGYRTLGMTLWQPLPRFVTDRKTFWEAVDRVTHPSEIATNMYAETDDAFYDALGTNVFANSRSTVHAIISWGGGSAPVVAAPLVLEASRSPVIRKDWYQREKTVETLFQKLQIQGMIQVRGTPASGKTTLLQLFHAYIIKEAPDAEVYVFDEWPKPKKEDMYNWELSHLQHEVRRLTFGSNDGVHRYLLFDEGQSTDWDDHFFWNQVIKRNERLHTRYRVVLFCKYATPGTDRPGGLEPEDIYDLDPYQAVPPVILSAQKVSLSAIDNDEYLPPIGLLFNKTDFEDAIKLRGCGVMLASEVIEELFHWTFGHAGVMGNEAGRNQQGDFTLKDLRKLFSVGNIKSTLSKMPNLLRGTPPAQTLKSDNAINRVLLEVLSRGSAYRLDFDGPDERRALKECYEQGWLHADALEKSHPSFQTYFDRPFYVFPSPLHAVYVSQILHPTESDPPQEILLQFVTAVIKEFAPSRLNPSTDCRMGIAFYERTPESQYRDEFYRAANVVTAGAVRLCPEFMSARKDRRIDFFVGSKGWGIEVTREGDRLDTAQNFGDYVAWLEEFQLEDSILLDFRTTQPIKLHKDIHNLYYVVLSENFSSFEMLDYQLQEVARSSLTEM